MKNIIKRVLGSLSSYRIQFCLNNGEDGDSVLLNIGSGNWECPGWICLDYPSEWYSKAQSGHKFVPYDIRSESIPYPDNSVDAIYCSHVVEHIENHHIQRFFQEVYRVLKVGGGISCLLP